MGPGRGIVMDGAWVGGCPGEVLGGIRGWETSDHDGIEESKNCARQLSKKLTI